MQARHGCLVARDRASASCRVAERNSWKARAEKLVSGAAGWKRPCVRDDVGSGCVSRVSYISKTNLMILTRQPSHAYTSTRYNKITPDTPLTTTRNHTHGGICRNVASAHQHRQRHRDRQHRHSLRKKGVFLAGRLPPKRQLRRCSSMASPSFPEAARRAWLDHRDAACVGSAAATSSVAGVNPSPIAGLLAAAQLWAADGGCPRG